MGLAQCRQNSDVSSTDHLDSIVNINSSVTLVFEGRGYGEA